MSEKYIKMNFLHM